MTEARVGSERRVRERFDRVYRQQQDILGRTAAGEAFLIPIRGKLADLQRIFALSPVAEFIWSQTDGKRTLAEIAANIAGEFDVDEARAREDLAGFVTALLEANLIAEVAHHARTG